MATSSDDTEYVCTLSDELIVKAEEELNEKAEWRARDIQALREMILKKPELKIRTDDAYLLRFLRAKKFDYDRAFNLIMKHFSMRADEKNKQLFDNLLPSTVKHVLDAGVTGVLPHRDKQGRRVMIFRPGKWDPSKYAIDDIFRANFISLTKLVEEEEAQISGIILLADLKSMGWKQTRRLKPLLARRIIGLLQDSFPMRFKGIHYVNEPVIFDMIFAVIRPFMKQKILDRIHFHGTKYEELSEFIEPQYIPSEYRGSGPPFTNEEWTKTLLSSEDEFIKEARYGLVKALGKPEITCKDETLDCLAGSYRNIDS
ncbi:alpha-tocopherol transfer protein-like isoform X1 [Ruditapes philippinarum]|uniref:alpha-tocopherol transfer protein-like isoform X1 n=1 Tax=Ruditapes philippinarum TaxID=129788 RepID=UPI00295B94D7|nr:alpha-tocopherol transfer protein-like isoform X1 [Ruditapes philippinarum]XP_060565185.1 alpha-tocopherol transfer protein-like isoform X1 [Ruditapes philippinarum]